MYVCIFSSGRYVFPLQRQANQSAEKNIPSKLKPVCVEVQGLSFCVKAQRSQEIHNLHFFSVG